VTPEYRAMKAQQLMDDEVLQDAFATLEQAAYRDALAMSSWHPFANTKRRHLLERIKIIHQLRSELESVIATGKAAARPRSGVA
jgi:hypothetical protein